jgi:hypothetical protein
MDRTFFLGFCGIGFISQHAGTIVATAAGQYGKSIVLLGAGNPLLMGGLIVIVSGSDRRDRLFGRVTGVALAIRIGKSSSRFRLREHLSTSIWLFSSGNGITTPFGKMSRKNEISAEFHSEKKEKFIFQIYYNENFRENNELVWT